MIGDKIDYDRYADELLAFIDAMKLREPIDVVGLSAGGNIAALAIARQPQKFRSLILISSTFGGELDPAGARYRAENARTVVIEGKDTLFRRFNEYIVSPNASLIARARYKTMIETTPYESLVAFLTTTSMPRMDNLPARVALPVMIPVGRDDTVQTPAMAEKVAREFRDARVVVIPTAGRLLPLESPEALNNAIRAFWTELDARPANGNRAPAN
jgi:3-oxoadipate enol-lactonase